MTSKRIDRGDAEVKGTLTATVSMALDGLSDVNAPTPSDTQVLTWNAATSKWINAASGGGTPTAITVANEGSDTSCYPAFFTAATGDLGPKTNTGLTFNASTGVLGATGFSGPLTGNVTGDCSGNAATATSATSATTATTATNISPTDESSDTTCFPVIVTAATGAQVPHTDASFLTYNANTGALGATRFNCLADAQVLTTAADTTTTLDGTYASDLLITGTAVMQVYNLGTATAYANGKRFTFYNGTPEFVGVLNTDGTVWHRVPPRAKCTCILANNSSASGVWWSEVCESKDPGFGNSTMYDFCGPNSTGYYSAEGGLTYVSSGTGAATATAGSLVTSQPGRQGTIVSTAGTTTTGYSMSYLFQGNTYIGSGCRSYQVSQSVSALSTSGEEYITRFGIGDNATGGAHTNGIYFVYDRLTNGDFWVIKNINASGNATTVTAVAPTANTDGTVWQMLRLEISSAANRSDFWIDRVKVSGTGGIATYLPLTTTALKSASQGITKSAGTTARYVKVDYLWTQSYPITLR
jgi:hypothetical protein